MPAPTPILAREKFPLIPKQMPRWFWPLVILVCLSFTAFTGTLCATMWARRSSEPVKLAVATAAKDARVAALGEPLEAGFLIAADSQTKDGVERRDNKFILRGSSGEGTVQLRAKRPADGGAWTLEYLRVAIAGQPIVLVGDPERPPEDFNAPPKQDAKKDGGNSGAQAAPAPAAKP